MAEPQIPGQLQGVPSEGNPYQVIGPTSPGYTEGQTPNQPGYAPAGNPSINPMVPQQRDYRSTREWGW
jgi:hypothetical protein